MRDRVEKYTEWLDDVQAELRALRENLKQGTATGVFLEAKRERLRFLEAKEERLKKKITELEHCEHLDFEDSMDGSAQCLDCGVYMKGLAD